MKVFCTLALPEGITDEVFDPPVTVRLAIRDVTMLDESSVTVAEVAVPVRSTADLSGRFELEAGLETGLEAGLEAGRHYAVHAHLDLSGDGLVSVGDLVSTVRVPVVADPTRRDVKVEVPVNVVV